MMWTKNQINWVSCSQNWTCWTSAYSVPSDPLPHPEPRGSRGSPALLLLLLPQGEAVAAAAKPRRHHHWLGRRWVNFDLFAPVTFLFPAVSWMDTCATCLTGVGEDQAGVINQLNNLYKVYVCLASALLWYSTTTRVRVRSIKAVLCPV